MIIYCPLCGDTLRQVIENYDTNKLGLYICDRCRRQKEGGFYYGISISENE